MALNFAKLLPRIDGIIDDLGTLYERAPGLILTEDDLKCLLYSKLSRIPSLARLRSTQDQQILGNAIHAELSWYGEYQGQVRRKLCIRPDITILEPENYSILHGFIEPRIRTTFERREVLDHNAPVPPHDFYGMPSLPSKQYEFGGSAITFELKVIRREIDDIAMKRIWEDYHQTKRLFQIVDSQGQKHALFSYIIIFSKTNYGSALERFQRFMHQRQGENRMKVIHKSARLEHDQLY